MPIPKSKRAVLDGTTLREELTGPAVALAQWDAFEDPTAWKRSKKGNLWRNFCGYTITLFRRDDDYYGWCVAGADNYRKFSAGGFEDEGDAMIAAGEEIGVGGM